MKVDANYENHIPFIICRCFDDDNYQLYSIIASGVGRELTTSKSLPPFS